MAESPHQEEVRHAVREHLYERPLVSQPPVVIRSALWRRGIQVTTSEVESALAFLAGLDQVASDPDGLGATRYYRITSAGTLAHERDQ